MKMTADEYRALGETAERYELIDGVVVTSPGPLPKHNEVLAKIIFQLESAASAGSGLRIFPETDIRFASAAVYRPDVSIYRTERLPASVDHLEAPPDLIVEVLSAGTKALDLLTKRDDYDRFGVAEYWTVDPANGEVRCWRRQGQRLHDVPIEGDFLSSSSLAGFTLDLRPIRAIIARAAGDTA